MNEVKVKRTTLLEVIKKNRDAHRDLFLKAQEGYREAVIKELDQMLADARDRKAIRRYISLPEPQDHTEDYDTVIAMLEMSVDDDITLAAHHFNSYVRDQWQWKKFDTECNAVYATKNIPRVEKSPFA